MKSTGIIFKDFSIAGIRKQWEFQNTLKEEQQMYANHARSQGISEEELADILQKGGELIGQSASFVGKKTETRRTRGLDKINENPNDWELCSNIVDNEGKDVNPLPMPYGDVWQFANVGAFKVFNINIKCPYGKIGDEIYVKEAYAEFSLFGHDSEKKSMEKISMAYKYKADTVEEYPFWKNPLFMPKAASRIKLEITGLSIERLHEITEEGAIREGIYQIEGGMWLSNGGKALKDTCRGSDPVYAYKMMWYLLHGQESWNKSPWVWVIQFTVKEFKQ